MWSVSSILAAVVSFFVEDTQTYGSIRTSNSRKKVLAKSSLSFNAKNKLFRELFPELLDRMPANSTAEEISEGTQSHSNSKGTTSGLTRRRGNAANSDDHDTGADNEIETSSDMSDKLAFAIIGVPLTALFLVVLYALIYGM